MSWKDEHAAVVSEQYKQGASASTIARIINTKFKTNYSRNAVISKAHRLGLTTAAPAGLRRFRNLASATRTHRARAFAKASPLAGLPTSPLPAAHDYDVPRVAFADLEPHHCRFPVGEPTQGFCGHSKVTGLAYCEVHARRCYTPATPRTKRHDAFVLRKIIGTPKILEDA